MVYRVQACVEAAVVLSGGTAHTPIAGSSVVGPAW
jgi:hypothetical protein